MDVHAGLMSRRAMPCITGVSLAEPGQRLYIVRPDTTVVEDGSQPLYVTPGTRLLSGDSDGYANVGVGQGTVLSIGIGAILNRVL